MDSDDWYGGGDLDERLKRRLDEQEKWCKVMNSMKPTEMVATAMSNINAFLLKEYGRQLLPERQLLFRSIFEKQEEMPEGILDWMEGTTLRELAEISRPLHPKRESVRVNEACRWIYRTAEALKLFCQNFHNPYKKRLWDNADLSPRGTVL
jgi:hypothetical protein